MISQLIIAVLLLLATAVLLNNTVSVDVKAFSSGNRRISRRTRSMSPPLSLSSPTSIILEAALSSSSGTGTEQHNHKVSPQNDDRLTSMPTTDTFVDPRSCILRIGAQAGKLCQLGLTMTTPKTKAQLNTFGGKKLFDDQDDQDQDDTTTNSSELMDTMTALFIGLWNLSSSLQLNWIDSVRSKMVLNAKKYPIEHCKGMYICMRLLLALFLKDRYIYILYAIEI